METSPSVATSSMPARDDQGGLIVSRGRVGMADDWRGLERVLNEGMVAFGDGATAPSEISLPFKLNDKPANAGKDDSGSSLGTFTDLPSFGL